MTLVLQAEGIRYGVEHWRRHMDRVSGTLYWQLNDCWPVASWSSLDYFGRWKALHYAARRFYAPVMLSIAETGTQMAVHVTSDLQQLWTGSVRWTLETLDGAVVKRGEQSVSAAPQADTPVVALDFAAEVNDGNQRELIFVAELWQDGVALAVNVATVEGALAHGMETDPLHNLPGFLLARDVGHDDPRGVGLERTNVVAVAAAPDSHEGVDVVHARRADLVFQTDPVVRHVFGAQPDCIGAAQAGDFGDAGVG